MIRPLVVHFLSDRPTTWGSNSHAASNLTSQRCLRLLLWSSNPRTRIIPSQRQRVQRRLALLSLWWHSWNVVTTASDGGRLSPPFATSSSSLGMTAAANTASTTTTTSKTATDNVALPFTFLSKYLAPSSLPHDTVPNGAGSSTRLAFQQACPHPHYPHKHSRHLQQHRLHHPQTIKSELGVLLALSGESTPIQMTTINKSRIPPFGLSGWNPLLFALPHYQQKQQRRWRSNLAASSNSDIDNKNNTKQDRTQTDRDDDEKHQPLDQKPIIVAVDSSSSETATTTTTISSSLSDEKQGDRTQTAPTSSSSSSLSSSTSSTESAPNSTASWYDNPYLFFPPTSDSSESSSSSLWKNFLFFQKRDKNQSKSKKTNAKVMQRFRRIAGDVLISVGFGTSAASALWSFTPQDYQKIQDNVRAMAQYLQTSEIDLEIRQVLAASTAPNALWDQVVWLSRAQRYLAQQQQNGDPRQAFLLNNDDDDDDETDSSRKIITLPEALRYIKCALAVYGDSVIQAAQMDLTGQIRDPRIVLFGSERDQAELSRSRVSDHIGIPPKDIVVLNVAHSHQGGGRRSQPPDQTNECLRHFIAVDHGNRKVVLSMRGTFSLSELVSDVVAFSRPFCGGQAHSEMANMAETIWESCSETIIPLLLENPGYDLVLTGHSLGAGTAALLHVWLHANNPPREWVEAFQQPPTSAGQNNENDDAPKNSPPNVQCCLFASPPVFAPFEAIPPAALQSCTHFIHGVDVVPFLSVDSVRQVLYQLAKVKQRNDRLGPWWKRWSRSLWRRNNKPGSDKKDTTLQFYARAVEQARKNRLPEKEGAPILYVPAAHNYWILEDVDDEENKNNQVSENQDEDAGDGTSSTGTASSSSSSSTTNETKNVDAWKTYSVEDCDAQKLALYGIQVHLKMVYDHFPQRYEYALNCLVESAKENDNNSDNNKGKGDENVQD